MLFFETFRKIFLEKFGGSEKRCTFAPPNGRGGKETGAAGRPGAGARRKPGREPGRTRNGEFIDRLRQKQ